MGGGVHIGAVKRPELSLTEKEAKVLEVLRDLDYGELVVTVKGGIPVHIEEIKKSIKL